MRRIYCALIVTALTALTAIACGDQLPSEPSDPGANNLTGTWRGTITVTNVSTTMTWTLTQTGSTAAGPAVISLPTGVVLMNGTVTGTISGNSFPFTLTVPPGGILAQPACSGQITGTSTLPTSTTMNGTYSVASSTCATGLASGVFTLDRQ